MTELELLIRQKLSQLRDVPIEFLSQLETVQLQLYKELLKLLKDLQLDENGIIKKGQLSKIAAIAKNLKSSMFKGDYVKAVQQFMSEFYKQRDLTQKYFSLFGPFTDQAIYDQAFTAAIESVADSLNGNAIDQVFINPIKKILMQSMTTNTSYADMLHILSESVAGESGLLTRYFSQKLRDSFAQVDRQYTLIISQDLGYEYYLYAGGELETSRPFCIERHGKIFHISEIKAWAKLDWKGKDASTTEGNIMILIGGYNCIHIFLPISIDSVPDDVLARIQNK